MELSSILRESYLDPTVDPSSLGFLCIFLGGSLAYGDNDHLRNFDKVKDWDGIGLVDSKEDIVHIFNEKVRLCAMLRIETQECPNLEVYVSTPVSSFEFLLKRLLEKLPVDTTANSLWEVLRFSGYTREGSKRTIKIWSRNHLLKIVRESTPSQIGVLSFKVVRYTHRCNPCYGPQLFLSQPIKISEQLYVLQDKDLLEVPPPLHKPIDLNGDIIYDVAPGVTCDLLLSARCLFESTPGLATAFKSTILSKWALRSGAQKYSSILSIFYRRLRFSDKYLQDLRSEYDYIQSRTFSGESKALALALEEIGLVCRWPKKSVSITANSSHMQRYNLLSLDLFRPTNFVPSSSQIGGAIGEVMANGGDRKHLAQVIDSSVYELRSTIPLDFGPFSSNSTGYKTEICLHSGKLWETAFMKTVPAVSFSAELAALPIAQTFFPRHRLQAIIAADKTNTRLFYKHFSGDMLNRIRLQYCLGPKLRNRVSVASQHDTLLSADWLLSIELHRAQDVLAAYQASWNNTSKSSQFNTVEPETCLDVFYIHRLKLDKRINVFYGSGSPSFLNVRPNENIPLRMFLEMEIVLNGNPYPPLRTLLDKALQVLDPKGKMGFLPTAFGLGDSHGGNVLINENNNDINCPRILYVDYEAAGFHTPFLDMAKPLYLDGFFDILYADLMHENLTAADSMNDCGLKVQWAVDGGKILIDYQIELELLEKGLAAIKLEYILSPVLKLLRESMPSSNTENLQLLAEETLGYAMFTCALLTRDFSARADVFYLNLALGIRLATELKDVLSEVFGWDNWGAE